MTQSAPRVIGRYAVHGELASGGMAAVHFARLIGSDGFARTVALKRPHPHLVRDPDFSLMFIDEARLAARIRHPNVVSTLDVIRTSDELVLVMDYVHGEALSKLARSASKRGERVPVAIAASIMIDVLHGLHAAHEATDEQGRPLGIVHRDVSPQNVLVGLDGITRIVDFGIAKAAGRSQETQDGAIKGKFSYMAPEQLRGEEVSRLTDVFAASIVFWELLTGERLFQGKNDAETMHMALVSRIRPPSMFVQDLPPEFDEIMRRGLSRDLGQRFPTARDMALAIEACVPAIRPSEIGAWVERMAGDTLRARAQIIAEMERSTSDGDIELQPTIAMASDRRISAPTPAHPQALTTIATPGRLASERPGPLPGAAGTVGTVHAAGLAPALAPGLAPGLAGPTPSTKLSVSWAQAFPGPLPSRENVSDEGATGISQVSHVAEISVAPTAAPPKSRKGAVIAAILVLIVVGASGTMFLGRRSVAQVAPSPEGSAAGAAGVEAPSSAGGASAGAGGDPVAHAPAAALVAPRAIASASASAAASSLRPSQAAQAAQAAQPGAQQATRAPSTKPASTPRTPRAKSECDTPYTIDSVGRRIFKIECM